MTNGFPKTGSFAVELANQAGGLVQLVGQPVTPLVAATQCLVLKSPQTYQWITIPNALYTGSQSGGVSTNAWNPAVEAAYGSVDISSDGNTVNFQNIRQFTLTGGSGTPTQLPTSPQTGTCAASTYGSMITVPGQLVITTPGNGNTASPQALMGLGANGGLLLEDNGAAGATSPLAGTSPPLDYNNLLGAGTGAIGLLKPASALDTSTVVGAQYLGFIYAAGRLVTGGGTSPQWTSHLASFGFSSAPASCASVAAGSATLIYGGDFTNDDPSTSSSGFGNCDFAIDLGTQDSSSNGLYRAATVWVGASYAGNKTGTPYSFPAVAIAGQLNGKYAIFVLGVESAQPWAIYLLQSN